MSQAPESHFKSPITPWKIAKNQNGPWTSLMGPGGADWWKNQIQKISWDCPLKQKEEKCPYTANPVNHGRTTVGTSMYVCSLHGSLSPLWMICFQQYPLMLYEYWSDAAACCCSPFTKCGILYVYSVCTVHWADLLTFFLSFQQSSYKCLNLPACEPYHSLLSRKILHMSQYISMDELCVPLWLGHNFSLWVIESSF